MGLKQQSKVWHVCREYAVCLSTSKYKYIQQNVILTLGKKSTAWKCNYFNFQEILKGKSLQITVFEMGQIDFEKMNTGISIKSNQIITNSVALVRKRTIPTEQPPLVSELSANFCG
jgi:hypothetical protein